MSEIPHANTGTALILVETSTGRNMIMVAESANAQLTPEMIRRAESALRSADLVFAEVESNVDTAWETLRLCERHQVPFVLDASPCQRTIELPDNRMLAIVLEEAEPLSVAGTSAPDEAIAELHRTGCQKVVVVQGNEQIRYSDGQSVLIVKKPLGIACSGTHFL